MFMAPKSHLASFKEQLLRIVLSFLPTTHPVFKRLGDRLCEGRRDRAARSRGLPQWYSAAPRSRFAPSCHPRVEAVVDEVDAFFLRRWDFPSEKARKKFLGSDFTRNICFNYPEALDDRITLACKLITLLFLVDDLLDYMTLESGREYNERLMSIFRGESSADDKVPVESIAGELWREMRERDAALTDAILEPLADFMAAQTEKTRLEKMSLGEYLEWRRRDVGASLITAVGCFSMGLSLGAEDLALLAPLERIWPRHVSVMNDVFSYAKEVRAAAAAGAGEEGAALCNSVAILMDEAAGLDHDSARRMLTVLCREWERSHAEAADRLLARRGTPEIRQYIRGLEHQFTGNEIWSTFSQRYADQSLSL